MPHTTSNDAEKPGNGNRERIRQAYITLFTGLCRFAVSKIENKEDAEDIVGEVFLKMLQNPEAIKDYDSLPAFLYKSVLNGCLDYLKHHKIKRKHEEDVALNFDLSQQQDNNNPLSLLISKEKENELLDTIDQLPEMCGKALLERLKGLSYQEIAGKLGISVNTVHTHIANRMYLNVHTEEDLTRITRNETD